MQALNFSAAEKQLKLIEKEIPSAKNARDVVIRVKYSGICGTDLHILQGEFPCKSTPVSLGHEFSGVVTEIGGEVTCVKVGDGVSVDPNHGCDVCESCRSGNPHFCKAGGVDTIIGIYKDGGWAEYSVVPDAQVHKLPEGISLEKAALCEPLSCIAHGWDRISPLTVGQRILITGAGIIGNLWVVTLHLQGHRKVTVSEPNLKRLEMLKQSFPEYAFVSPDVLKKRQEENSDYQFDLVIDCSGNVRAIEQGFQLLKPGGKLCIFGVAPPHAKLSLSPFDIFKKELTVLGVNINPFTFPKAIGLAESLGERYLDYKLLGIKVFKLSEYEEALKDLKEGTISKAMFKM